VVLKFIIMIQTSVMQLNENQGIIFSEGGAMPVVAAYNHAQKTVYILRAAKMYGIAFPESLTDYQLVTWHEDHFFLKQV